jgi:hypothetical protein
MKGTRTREAFASLLFEKEFSEIALPPIAFENLTKISLRCRA